MGTYEFFDHTADVGMRVRADSFDDLLVAAVQGLMQLVAPDGHDLVSTDRYGVDLNEGEPALVLFDLLNEALYRFAVDGFVVLDARIEPLTEGGYHAELAGSRFPAAHPPTGCEVKAVTYHGLAVEETGAGWTGQVIFDI